MTMPGDSIVGAARRRSELEKALQELERAVSAPAATATWIDDLTHHIRQLELALNHHIVEVQSPSGLLDQIVDKAPRLQRSVERVRLHHAMLAQSITQILRTLGAARNADEMPTGEIRANIVALLAEMTRHRQEGADLIYEAYAVDIGGY